MTFLTRIEALLAGGASIAQLHEQLSGFTLVQIRRAIEKLVKDGRATRPATKGGKYFSVQQEQA